MTLSNLFIIKHINLRILFSVLLFAIVVCVFAQTQTPVETFRVTEVEGQIFRYRGNKIIANGDTLFFSDTLTIPKNGKLVVCKERYHYFKSHYHYAIEHHAGTFPLAEFLRYSHKEYYRHPMVQHVENGIIDDSLLLPPIIDDTLVTHPNKPDTAKYLRDPIIKDTLVTTPNKPDTAKNLMDRKPPI